MANAKIKIAEALFPLLSSFQELNGLTLKCVRQIQEDGSLSRIILDFDSKALILDANVDDDTISFLTISSSGSKEIQDSGVTQGDIWEDLVEQKFGWGWVTVNQQGYLDGILLSFGGIIPQVVVNVIASSLEVGRISTSARSTVSRS